ncbi:zinc finger BED domain-containing protein 5-like [Diabrotica undecimpunctata]|uniref:zinc finger BED domain-containing protein 5-like n=1 Tax=Diabrotica undecimpunctata TaxID=50387 RepID=UPI003B635383
MYWKPTNILRIARRTDTCLKTITYHSKKVNKNALMVSYLVRYRVAQAGEAHTIPENLIKPCVKDIIECMLDDKAKKLVSTVPLSINTILRSIGDLAEDVKATLISRSKSTKCSLQTDESTDVAVLTILIAFVRYQHLESFQEDLLSCKPLTTNTSGAEISESY